MRGKYFFIIGLGLSLIIAFFLSQLASNCPDGLEKIAEDQGFPDNTDNVVLWKDSPAPDYIIPGLKSEGLATGAAGVAGTLAVAGLGFIVSRFIGLKRRKDNPNPDEPEPKKI